MHQHSAVLARGPGAPAGRPVTPAAASPPAAAAVLLLLPPLLQLPQLVLEGQFRLRIPDAFGEQKALLQVSPSWDTPSRRRATRKATSQARWGPGGGVGRASPGGASPGRRGALQGERVPQEAAEQSSREARGQQHYAGGGNGAGPPGAGALWLGKPRGQARRT